MRHVAVGVELLSSVRAMAKEPQVRMGRMGKATLGEVVREVACKPVPRKPFPRRTESAG